MCFYIFYIITRNTSFISFFGRIRLFFVSFFLLFHTDFVRTLLGFRWFGKESLSLFMSFVDWKRKKMWYFGIDWRAWSKDYLQMSWYYFGRTEGFTFPSFGIDRSFHFAWWGYWFLISSGSWLEKWSFGIGFYF